MSVWRLSSNEMHNLNDNYDKTNINSCALRNILLFSQSPFQLLGLKIN